MLAGGTAYAWLTPDDARALIAALQAALPQDQ